MKDSNWGKSAAGAGVLFAITLVLGFILATGDWQTSDSDASILEYFNDSANQTLMVVGAFIMTLSGVAFI